jgi:hypothetical protein
MTDEQINKDLHEKVMGKCWHEDLKHPDYLNNWYDYGELVKVVMERDEIKYLINDNTIPFVIVDHWAGESKKWFRDYMFDSRRGSMAIWEFFCKNVAKVEK